LKEILHSSGEESMYIGLLKFLIVHFGITASPLIATP